MYYVVGTGPGPHRHTPPRSPTDLEVGDDDGVGEEHVDVGGEGRPLEGLGLLLAAPVDDGGHGQEHEEPYGVERGADKGEEVGAADLLQEEERLEGRVLLGGDGGKVAGDGQRREAERGLVPDEEVGLPAPAGGKGLAEAESGEDCCLFVFG